MPASELHAEVLLEEAEPDLAEDDESSTPSGAQFDEYGLLNGTEKSNVNITDDNRHQKLSLADIEALKSDRTSNPRDLIAKIMANHAQLDQKTAFSLAKYTLRKQKKYMKRFTVLPLDVAMLTDWMMLEKDFTKIMEIRNEVLALLLSWANVHASESTAEDDCPRCRYLVVDDTGGLVVAAIAERMDLLHRTPKSPPQPPVDIGTTVQAELTTKQESSRRHYDHSPRSSNTITLVHANQQPNLALMRYFSFDPTQPPSSTTPPTETHPLHTHLSSVSWLQLLRPEQDSTYADEPQTRTSEELADMKPNHRSTYHRKRRRWQRTKAAVSTARAGGFNALVIATPTDSISICHRLVPLLDGGAQVVVYSPHLEPLLALVDVYSTARRAAFINLSPEEQETRVGGPDFPVDPTLTLGFTVQTIRARRWQVLPGRSHPLMTSRGGAEGYIAVATRVIPIEGGVAARGRVRRGKRKGATGELDRTENGDTGTGAGSSSADMDADIVIKPEPSVGMVDEAEAGTEQTAKRVKVEGDM